MSEMNLSNAVSAVLSLKQQELMQNIQVNTLKKTFDLAKTENSLLLKVLNQKGLANNVNKLI